MKVLVTGCDGYIGMVLTKKLLKNGFDVVGLDTGYYRNGWLVNGNEKLPAVISKDIRQVTAKDLEGVDVVIHLAELSNDPLGKLDEKLTYQINHLGTAKLARVAKKAGVARFVYSSSCSVYGASNAVLDETSLTNPQTAYAKCKLLNEAYLLKLADATFTPVILRNATVYGVSPRMRFDLAINNLSGIAFTTNEIKMESDGTAWRPFVHVSDVADAMIAAAIAPKSKVGRQIFNIGSSNSNYQIKDVARIISEVYLGCKITLNSSVTDTRNYIVSFKKAEKTLPGFKPQKSIKPGVIELIRVFKKIDLTKDVFESDAYSRLKRVQHLLETKQIDKELYWKD